jgi:hypothetical protein
VIIIVSNNSDAPNVPIVHHDPVMAFTPGAGETNLPESPFAPAVIDGVRLAILPRPETGERDLPASTRSAVPPEKSRDDILAVYHRPLEQVADRAELFTLGTTVPYLVPQQGLVVPPTVLRGDPAVRIAAAPVQQPPVPPESEPSAGLLRSRALRYWLLPVAACILQGLRLSPMPQPRLPRLRRFHSASGQE